jgi:hypothetical protein
VRSRRGRLHAVPLDAWRRAAGFVECDGQAPPVTGVLLRCTAFAPHRLLPLPWLSSPARSTGGDEFVRLFRRLSHPAVHLAPPVGRSIVKRVAELHGGQVEVISQPGAGSALRVTLPAAV